MISMANNTKVFTIKINGVEVAAKSINDLNKILKQTEDELNSVEIGSDQFNELSENANKVREQISKVNESLQETSSQKQADALKKVGESLAGGFAIATVALDAFGISGKSLEQAQTRALQLIAALDGLKKITEGLSAENLKYVKQAIDGFKQSALYAKLFGTTTRAALTATGIGLFVVALGLVVTYWEDILELVGNVDKTQEEYFKKQQARIQANNEMLQKNIKDQEFELELLRARGTEQDVLLKKEIEIAKARQQILENSVTPLRQEYLRLIREQESLQRAVDNSSKSFANQAKGALEEAKKKTNEASAAYHKVNDELIAARNNVTILTVALQKATKDEADKAFEERIKKLAENYQKERERVLHEEEIIAEATAELRALPEFVEEQERYKENQEKFYEDLAESNRASFEKGLEAATEPLQSFELPKNTRTVFQALLGLNAEGELDEESQAQIAAIQYAVQSAFATLQSVGGLLDQQIENRRDALDSLESETTDTMSRISSLEEQLQSASLARRDIIIARIQNERDRERELAKEKEKAQAELEKAEKKRATLQKASDIAQAVGGTALAVVRALEAGPIAGPIFAAIIGALGAAQVGIIAAQKYKRGGLLNGPSHEQGGIKTPFGEMEGGEAVINKRSTKMFKPLLSRINQAGGGVKFAEGGITAQPDFASLSRASQTTPDMNNLIREIRNIRPTVSVQEIDRVNRITTNIKSINSIG